MAISSNSPPAMTNREPSNYTASNGVRQTVHDNPIPSEMIGECIKQGEVVSNAPHNPMKVTLRYEEGAEHIELRVDLEDSKVFQLNSSYERSWRRASD